MADCKPKIKAVSNIPKNRLYLTMSGNITVKLLEKFYTDIRFCVADLKPGFNVISDISQCNIIYISSLTIYKKIIQYLVDNKIGNFIWIIKYENVGCKQMINFTEKIQCYEIMYAHSVNEAEEMIENSTARDGIRFKLNGPQVEYNVNNESGNGSIVDISVSGCAVESATIPISPGAEIPICINFDEHDTIQAKFTVNAKVARANDTMFAVHFLDLNDEHKEQLYKRLSYEVGRAT